MLQLGVRTREEIPWIAQAILPRVRSRRRTDNKKRRILAANRGWKVARSKFIKQFGLGGVLNASQAVSATVAAIQDWTNPYSQLLCHGLGLLRYGDAFLSYVRLLVHGLRSWSPGRSRQSGRRRRSSSGFWQPLMRRDQTLEHEKPERRGTIFRAPNIR